MSDESKKADDGLGELDAAFDAEIKKNAKPAEVPAAAAAAAAAAPAAPVVAETPAEGKKKPRKNATREKKAKKPALTPHDKAIRKLLRAAELTELPPLDVLLKGKHGEKVKVKDIAIFVGNPKDDPLKSLAKSCPLKNRTNLSAEVNLDRAIAVGAMILSDKRLHHICEVARITEDGVLDCIAGRHRLTFFALAYGPEVEIPVYIEDMDLNTARDAVVVSNMCRPTKAIEKAEHAALAAVSGNVSADQDELYAKMAKSKAKVLQYCVFSVTDRKHPKRLGFTASLTSGRKDGGMTTVSNVVGYWGAALNWHDEMKRKEFDSALKASIEFLNDMVEAMQKIKEFNSKSHLASKPLIAIGKCYAARNDVNKGVPANLAGKVAKAIVAMGDIGRQKSEKTYEALMKAL